MIFGSAWADVFERAFLIIAFMSRSLARRAILSIIAASTREYHTSSCVIVANAAMRSLYELTAASAARAHALSVPLIKRPASIILVANRLTSHSHGAGKVSSKSLMSKIRFRSGVANNPKFIKWQSPHACALFPSVGVFAKSLAMIAAEPRKNANGDASIRP